MFLLSILVGVVCYCLITACVKCGVNSPEYLFNPEIPESYVCADVQV